MPGTKKTFTAQGAAPSALHEKKNNNNNYAEKSSPGTSPVPIYYLKSTVNLSRHAASMPLLRNS